MQSASTLEGKVAIVTGAGAGLGRSEALALAAAGASVVINDVSDDAADAVIAEIQDAGGQAEAVVGDIGERSIADALLDTATRRFDGLDIVVNNAGFCRDRFLFSMTDEEWDSVVRVHLRGHFLLSRNASAYWKAQSKAAQGPVYGRVINTASEAFLFGAEAQPNYAAAKAGIAALTVATARSMARYGVKANAICPRARTAMTAAVFGPAPEDGPDPLSVEHVAPFVAFLASPAAEQITGQVFVVHGGMVALMAPPTVERRFDATNGIWTADDLAGQVGSYFTDRDPAKIFAANELKDLA